MFTPSVRRPGYDRGHSVGRVMGREEGRREGFARGHQEGRREGRAQGLAEGRREGLERGRREGLAEGRRAGFDAGAAALVQRLLEHRLGTPLPGDTERLLAALGSERLAALAEALPERPLDSPEDLKAWLSRA